MKIQFFSRALPMATCALLLTAGLYVPLRAQTLALDAARAVGNLRFSNGTSGWTLYDAPSLSALSVVPLQAGEVVGVKRALQLDVHTAKGSNPWDIQLGHELAVGIANGEAVRLSFWGKADREAKIGAGVELGSGDYQKLAFDTLTLSPTWKHYEVIGRAARDFAPGQTHVTLQLGAQDAKITLAGMRVEDPDHPLPPAVVANEAPFKVRSLVPSADFSSGWSGDGVDVSPLPADDVRGGGVQLTVKTKPANPWEARFDAPNAQPISGGDTLALRIWARSPTKSTVSFFFQQSVAPYEKLLNQKVILTSDWKEYRFVTGIDDARDFAAKGTNFEMHVGYDAGTIEVRNARVENYGDATIAEVNTVIGGQTIDFWGSRPHDDGWREAALQRIERFRKANLRVRVVDGKGNSVRGAKVSLAMTRHAFRWGTAVTSAPFWNSEGESARKYKQLVLANFNTIVLENGMKWPANSPAQQEINDSILSWAKQNNIEVRGHNLVWGSTQFMPPVINGKSLAELSNDELRAAIEAHVRDYTRRFKGRVYVWDAVNEAVAERDIWERVGWGEFAKVFQIARGRPERATRLQRLQCLSLRRGFGRRLETRARSHSEIGGCQSAFRPRGRASAFGRAAFTNPYRFREPARSGKIRQAHRNHRIRLGLTRRARPSRLLRRLSDRLFFRPQRRFFCAVGLLGRRAVARQRKRAPRQPRFLL